VRGSHDRTIQQANDGTLLGLLEVPEMHGHQARMTITARSEGLEIILRGSLTHRQGRRIAIATGAFVSFVPIY